MIDAYRTAARRIEKHCAAEQLIAYWEGTSSSPGLGELVLIRD
jgi:hypothetical protein